MTITATAALKLTTATNPTRVSEIVPSTAGRSKSWSTVTHSI
jgi:hypothetical protein